MIRYFQEKRHTTKHNIIIISLVNVKKVISETPREAHFK